MVAWEISTALKIKNFEPSHALYHRLRRFRVTRDVGNMKNKLSRHDFLTGLKHSVQNGLKGNSTGKKVPNQRVDLTR
jgi:hypothetical protein